MKKLLVVNCLLLILFIPVSSYISAGSVSNPVRNSQFLNGTNRELFFGPIILNLEGTGILTSKSAEGNISKGGKTETLHFSIDAGKTSLNTVRSKDYVRIEGLKPYGNPGEPMLPFKSFVITLPINSEVSGVSVSGVSYRPILNKLDIVLTPPPVAHTRNAKQTADTEKQIKNPNRKQTTNENKSYSKCKTCDSESFFPGNLVSYYTGQGNNNRYVFIKFFPMQYIPNSKRAILVTDADITVNYQLTHTERSGE